MAESCVCVPACVVQPRGVCARGGGEHSGVLRESAPHPLLPPCPSHPIHRTWLSLLLSPWLRGGGGRRQLGPAAAPAAPANPPPALSLPSTGWAPSPAALGGRGRKMVANEEGEWRELEPGLPSPISSSVSTPPLEGAGGWLLGPRWGRGPAGW